MNHPKLGELLLLDARSAYRFCLSTNSYYLPDKYGFSFYGRFVTFNHRSYSFLPGLFQINRDGEITSENLPHQINKMLPFIFKGDKKILFIEVDDGSDRLIEEYYKIITKLGENPEEYILNVVFKNGSRWEHYFEYIAIEHFSRKGFLTDVQLPWNYHGRPDFGLYKHPLVTLLNKNHLIYNLTLYY